MKQNTVFFDLDGTLTESGPGITKSVRYMLGKLGIEERDEANLRRFIGPPLTYSLTTFYGLSMEEAERGVKIYRAYFDVHGIFDNSVYAGIPELLDALKAAGKRLCIASGKPEYLIAPIVEHFGIARYFDVLGGSDENEARANKADVIAHVLAATGADKADVVMVGDRHHDVDGARANGIPCVGVLYGYGDRAELEAAGATAIAATVSDLQALLLP
mgnify:CR=1 FL=1